MNEENIENKDKVIKIKSLVKGSKDLVWERNTGNEIADSFQPFQETIGGKVKIGNKEYKIRLPLRKYVDSYLTIQKEYMKDEDLEIPTADALAIDDSLKSMIKDMIIGFDENDDFGEDFRMDDVAFDDITEFAMRAYYFLSRKSKGRRRG